MRKGKKGMTLIEVLVATLLFSVCIIIISQLLTQSMRAYKKYRHESGMKRVTDSLIDQISSEMRSAYDVPVANLHQIVFGRYFSDGNAYKIEYTYDAAQKQVKRSWCMVGSESSVNGEDIVATDIEQFNLDYSNADIYHITTEVVSGQNIDNYHEYQTITGSKRRVVTRADNVSITTE
jgi:prepilin-type N-terminal cleavage/methylation domain-containing protein